MYEFIMSESYWNIEDKDGFYYCFKNNVGQHSLDSPLGKYIYEYASNHEFKTYLEIGTWNGLGSTKCFVEAFRNRTETDYRFYSLECNTEKHNVAKDLYKDVPGVNILNEVLLTEMPNDIYHVFPLLLNNYTLQFYNNNDFGNMKDKPLFLDRSDIPEVFDVILLDGGEFTTYYEFQLLKNRCRVMLLDDTNGCKCKHIVTEMKENPDQWEIIVENLDDTGFVVAKNKRHS
jgi:hypothetical protein